MGHRTVVAYEVSEGVFNVHFSRWGAKKLFETQLSETTPYGGESSEPGYINGMIDADENSAGAITDAQTPTEINPTPVETNVPITDVVAAVNYLHDEALHIVRQDWSQRSFVVAPYLGDTPATAAQTAGVLVECSDAETYGTIFSDLRTGEWKEVSSRDAWRKRLKQEYGNRIPGFSPEP